MFPLTPDWGEGVKKEHREGRSKGDCNLTEGVTSTSIMLPINAKRMLKEGWVGTSLNLNSKGCYRS